MAIDYYDASEGFGNVLNWLALTQRGQGGAMPERAPAYNALAVNGGPTRAAAQAMDAPWLTYSNQGATRNMPLSDELVNALGFLPEMGIGMEVFSGGQPSSGPNRVGSHRHDDGMSGDVFFTMDGRRLDWRNPEDIPILQEIVRRGKSNGLTGFGAGEGYMQPGSMHIGFGAPAVWGAGGRGATAPNWLSQAYHGQG